MPSVAVIAAMAVLQLSSFADAHGYLSVPRSRNLVARQNNQFYAEPDLITRNPSGLEDYQDLLFPEMNPGAHEGEGIVNNPCGTFPDMNLGEINFGENNRPTWYGEVQARYQPGDTIEVEWVLTVQHYGRYSFRICPYIGDTATAADEQCFLDHVLLSPSGQAWIDIGSTWNSTIKDTLVLPDDFTCEHCLLSWRWDSLYTPEIWGNCADIQIGSGPWDPPGTRPPTPSATPPPPTAAPPPSPTEPPATSPPTACLSDWAECIEGGVPCCAGSFCYGSTYFKQCMPQ